MTFIHPVHANGQPRPFETWTKEEQTAWRRSLTKHDIVKTTKRPSKVYILRDMDSAAPAGVPGYANKTGPWALLGGAAIKDFIVGHYELRPFDWVVPVGKPKPPKPPRPTASTPAPTPTSSTIFAVEDFTVTLHIKRDQIGNTELTNSDVLDFIIARAMLVRGVEAIYNLG